MVVGEDLSSLICRMGSLAKSSFRGYTRSFAMDGRLRSTCMSAIRFVAGAPPLALLLVRRVFSSPCYVIWFTHLYARASSVVLQCVARLLEGFF